MNWVRISLGDWVAGTDHFEAFVWPKDDGKVVVDVVANSDGESVCVWQEKDIETAKAKAEFVLREKEQEWLDNYTPSDEELYRDYGRTEDSASYREDMINAGRGHLLK